MVNRTDIYGDVIEQEVEDPNKVLNVKPYGSPLFLIFLQEKPEILRRLSQLPSIFCCPSKKVKYFINNSYHIITWLDSSSSVSSVAGGLNDFSQGVVAIDFQEKGQSPSFILNKPVYKLSFEGKSDAYVFDYLREFLRVT